ncbi:MAG: aldolase/citrate lyase family protein [Bacteroidales bacterium]|nr:aldolase/citrate lyase family protein [Bacteroidales bacterium]
MKLNRIYQYISLNQEVPKILQTLKKCQKASIIPILDLEDSLQIPFDPEKTAVLKARARKILKTVLQIAKEQDLKIKTSLRINATDTVEFVNDIELLKEINPLITWGSLFLPKVHSAEILKEYINALDGINYEEMVVMAESQAFFDNYKEIITICKGEKIDKIHFGHWDYFYDARAFPIPLPDDKKLWDKVSQLLEMIEPEGFHYIRTPFCFLFRHDEFKSLITYLDGITSVPFGASTLSFSQALAICKLNDKAPPACPVDYSFTGEEQLKIANDLVEFFNRTVSPEYSFNIDTSIYRFYAPHEYLNALDFLKRNT